MKPTTTLAAAAAIGLTSLVAAMPATAQQVEQTHFTQQQRGPMQFERFGNDGRSQMGPGAARMALAAAVCSPEAGTRLETRLDAGAERLELTDEQSPLFEDFKTAALAAQTQFSETCQAVIDDRPDDLVEALRTHQAMLTARLDAIDAILPSFEALYDSLTDAQKLELVRMRGALIGFGDEGQQHQMQGRWHR